jgi:RNA polymerase sigma factor (sigma-70 family)
MEIYEQLVRQAQQHGADDPKRRELFGELTRQFQVAAQSWAFGLLGDFHQAQDATQEAFIAAYQHLDQLQDPRAFPAWLKRIVFSQCARQTRRPQPDTRPLDEGAHAAEVDDTEVRELVREAIDALPEHERVAIQLFYIRGYSQKEIAEQLDVPLTTVKKRLQYAREHLREHIPQLDAARCELHLSQLGDQGALLDEWMQLLHGQALIPSSADEFGLLVQVMGIHKAVM